MSDIAPVIPLPAVPVASVQGALALDLGPRLDPPEPPRPSRSRLDAWAHRYLQAVVEIACGDRPVTQVLRWTHPDVYADLARRAQLAARASGTTPGRGRGPGAVRPQVVGVHTSLVCPDVLEACVRVRHGERSRAVAARFELVRDRWQCVALEFA
ncbi:hypothetical protein DDE18_07220 [Nocardioides gansuensis]|uniref:Uncharacterized protein n=1 Tax=Nocardioides gansuensis TaxID=2138300 RepID=A0A2T8FBN0_9ACTN|nr:Rv3235 family protein [Nocardioides gansuensis]PVG83110.1 hypothetical protein DDE18_07220 [Nocardioides gansuensis]